MKLNPKSSNKDFVPHPETNGLVKGVIVDITPPEKKMTAFGEKETFSVVVESSEIKDASSGERFCVWKNGFTPSLNEKSNFRKFLKSALGRDVAETDLDSSGELDVDAICIGHAVQMIVVNETGKDGKTYANISHLMPDKSGNPLKPSGKYIRKQDRPARDAAHNRIPNDGEETRQPWAQVKVHAATGSKAAGQALGDLDQDVVIGLIVRWLPKFEANPKPTADDKRLAAALKEAKGVLEAMEEEDNIAF